MGYDNDVVLLRDVNNAVVGISAIPGHPQRPAGEGQAYLSRFLMTT